MELSLFRWSDAFGLISIMLGFSVDPYLCRFFWDTGIGYIYILCVCLIMVCFWRISYSYMKKDCRSLWIWCILLLFSVCYCFFPLQGGFFILFFCVALVTSSFSALSMRKKKVPRISLNINLRCSIVKQTSERSLVDYLIPH